jgi:hypothetical protein
MLYKKQSHYFNTVYFKKNAGRGRAFQLLLFVSVHISTPLSSWSIKERICSKLCQHEYYFYGPRKCDGFPLIPVHVRGANQKFREFAHKKIAYHNS